MKSIRKAVYRYGFESFGVRIGLESNTEELLSEVVEKLAQTIPEGLYKPFEGITEHNFLFKKVGNKLHIFKDGQDFIKTEHKSVMLGHCLSRVRLCIAQFAPNNVFLHSGAVVWDNKAILFPGDSYSGKTSIVAEFIKQGAIYHSDDNAILDERGFNHPFPKTLSIRGIIDEHQQLEVSHKDLGALGGIEPFPVSAVVLTKFEVNAEWKPNVLSPGNGVMALLPHTISIRNNPKFSLQVLNKLTERAIITQSKRGEAENTVKCLLEFLKNDTI